MNYFGGEPQDLGTCNILAVQGFEALVQQNFNAPIIINYNRSEFFALPEKKRNLAKRVPYLVPCSFPTSPCKRITANANGISLIFLDIDTEHDREGNITGTPAKPYADNPDTFYKHLEGLNFAVYTTAQSTRDFPRIRVVVEASGFAPELYPRAVAYIAKCMGLLNITSESNVSVQPMFRPTIFLDTPEGDHPLIASYVTGKPLTPDMFDGQETKSPSRIVTPQGSFDISGESLQFLRSPIEGVSLTEAKSALSRIDPDIDYKEWLSVVSALKHQFPTGEEQEKAFQIFDSWSSKGSKYVGIEETTAKWNSLKPTPIHRVPVTMRTLFRIAVESGWDGRKAKHLCFETTRGKIRSCTSLSELTGSAVQWIISTPLLTTLDEEALLTEIRRVGKVKFDYDVSLSHFKKELKRLKSNLEATRQKQEKDTTPAPPWARGLCFVEKTKLFYRFSNSTTLDPAAFDLSYSRFLLPSEIALEKAGQSNNILASAKPIILPRDYVLNHIKIPTAYDDFYDPRTPDKQFVTIDGKLFVNTYRRTHPEPEERGSVEAGEILQEHIRNMIKEPEYQKVFLDFLAFLVQYPGVKIRWAILLQSTKGGGKGFIAECMRIALGREHVKSIDSASIFSDYNDWAYGVCLGIMNEIRVVGHSRYDVMNKMKEPITDDRVSIRQKYRDHREVLNLTNYLMFTNHHDALAIEQDERRYFVLKSPLQSARDIRHLGRGGYFKRLYGMLEQNPGGLRHFLENWEIDADFPVNGPPPMTQYLEDMRIETAPELETPFDDFLEDKDSPYVQPDLIALGVLTNMFNAAGCKTNHKQTSHLLRSRGYEKAGRYSINGEKHTVWVENESPLQGLDLAGIITKRVNKE